MAKKKRKPKPHVQSKPRSASRKEPKRRIQKKSIRTSSKKTDRKSRVKHPQNSRSRKGSVSKKRKLAAKVSKKLAGRTVAKRNRNQKSTPNARRTRVTKTVTQRAKRNRPRESQGNASLRTFPIKHRKFIRTDEDGKRIREKRISGFQQVYVVEIPEGKTYDQQVTRIDAADLSFLQPALTRNKGLIPKGVVVTYVFRVTSEDDEEHQFMTNVSDPTTPTRTVEHIRDFLIRGLKNIEARLHKKSYKGESGKRVKSMAALYEIHIKFIY